MCGNVQSSKTLCAQQKLKSARTLAVKLSFFDSRKKFCILSYLQGWETRFNPDFRIENLHWTGFFLKKKSILNCDVWVGIRRRPRFTFWLTFFKLACYLYSSVDCFHIW